MEVRDRIRRTARALRERWQGLSRRTALALLAGVLVAAALFFSISWQLCFYTTCPDVRSLAAYQPGRAPQLLDRDGEVFADLTPVERAMAPLFSLPSHVPQAFLAVEDQRFYTHGGVDWRRVGGAVWADLRSGGFEQGFSTITMQLARNLFPGRIPGEQQSLARKLLEIRVAREIEWRYSKQEILELYLNHIYFGNRAHGVEAAARQYFGRPAQQLTLPQAALLAALPKAPSHYDPRRHPEAALLRRNLVLSLMEQQGRIPQRQAEEARRQPLGLAPPLRQARVEAGLAPWFVEQVRHELEERFGAGLYTRPIRVRTTLDSRAQRAAEEELARQLHAIESGALGAFSGPRYSPDEAPGAGGTPYLQGAVVMLDPRNGDVLAWVGGRNFSHSQFDRAAQARRQVGSAFKPFVYAAALRDGWVLSQLLPDRPFSVRLAGGQLWQPKNFSDRYDGEVTLRDALVRSKNVPTVHLAQAVGLDEVVGAARRAGIGERLPELPAMALGTVAVSPLELTSAYTAFAALGTAAEPRFVLSVEDEKGRVLWRPPAPRGQRGALDPRVAFLVTDVLREALRRGTGTAALPAGLDLPAAGKTGTTNDGADVWFVGYTPDRAASLWIGFDQPRPILADATGGRLAAPAWGRLMARAYAGRPLPAPWQRPAGVVERRVDPATGLLLAGDCAPLSGEPRRELFLTGVEPAAYCPGREPPPSNGFPVDRLNARRTQLAAEERRLAEREAALRQAEQAQQQKAAEREAEQEKLAAKARQDAEAEHAAEQAAQKAAERQAQRAEQRKAAERQAKETERRQEQERLAAKAKRDAEARRDAEAKQAAAERASLARRAAAADAAARQRAEREARLAAKEKELDEREAELRRTEQVERRAAARRPADDPESDTEERPAQHETEAQVEDAGSDLSGWWELTNRIETTSYPAYQGLRLGYRLQLEQDGDRITGRGQKWSEDGRTLGAAGRTPITVRGTVDGRTVHLRFTEQGARRATAGAFDWQLSADRDALRGSFWSDAAGARGSSVAHRMR